MSVDREGTQQGSRLGKRQRLVRRLQKKKNWVGYKQEGGEVNIVLIALSKFKNRKENEEDEKKSKQKTTL